MLLLVPLIVIEIDWAPWTAGSVRVQVVEALGASVAAPHVIAPEDELPAMFVIGAVPEFVTWIEIVSEDPGVNVGPGAEPAG